MFRPSLEDITFICYTEISNKVCLLLYCHHTDRISLGTKNGYFDCRHIGLLKSKFPKPFIIGLHCQNLDVREYTNDTIIEDMLLQLLEGQLALGMHNEWDSVGKHGGLADSYAEHVSVQTAQQLYDLLSEWTNCFLEIGWSIFHIEENHVVNAQ
ncbi:hypothetical protein J6590_090237 [Homalodisca vitripennis]|nr:hypothetical protein J6590_090237 [Homalodisca vitripennis]